MADHRYYQEAKRLIDAGYVRGMDMHQLAKKLEETQSKRMMDIPDKPEEEEVKDGVQVTVVDSRKAFIRKI